MPSRAGPESAEAGRARPRPAISHVGARAATSRLTFPAGDLYLRPALPAGPRAGERRGAPRHGHPGAARARPRRAPSLPAAQPGDARADRRDRGAHRRRRARGRRASRARRSPTGARSGRRARPRVLRRAVHVLLAREAEFVAVIRRETGQTRESRSSRPSSSPPATRSTSTRSARSASSPIARVPVHLMKTKKLRIAYQPLGVVGIVTPWNFPFMLSLNPTVQALVAGNAVLLKPSEATPHSGQLVEELLPRRRAARGRAPVPPRRRRDRARARRGRLRQDLVHRQRRAPGAGRRGLRPPADSLHARARRQGPDGRLRRRRPRARRGGRRVRRLRERRPGLRLDRARLRRRRGRRRVRPQGRREDGGAAPGQRAARPTSAR